MVRHYQWTLSGTRKKKIYACSGQRVFGARIWLGTIVGRFSINYFSGLGLRIRVRFGLGLGLWLEFGLGLVLGLGLVW